MGKNLRFPKSKNLYDPFVLKHFWRGVSFFFGGGGFSDQENFCICSNYCVSDSFRTGGKIHFVG